MGRTTQRLYFIDAIRAWAILMMLQGHFIDGLLDPAFRDPDDPLYATWLFFRGITAPVFFTVSGFIFTYLLVRVPEKGWENPRVRKGIKRGLQLLLIGYALRMNLGGLLKGQFYPAFFMVDVLHCIGLSLIAIIGAYLLTARFRLRVFASSLLAITAILFLFEPAYAGVEWSFLPKGIANYLTRAHGSVFTLIPWLGYTAFGGFLALVFRKFRESSRLYPYAIASCTLLGALLVYQSSPFFDALEGLTGIGLFGDIVANNYLIIRLGNVLVAFGVFMALRRPLRNPVFLALGKSTLSIYVIHFIILYGSFTGLGLYRFFHHKLTPLWALGGAIAFMTVCGYLSLQYERTKPVLREHAAELAARTAFTVGLGYRTLRLQLRPVWSRLRASVYRILGLTR